MEQNSTELENLKKGEREKIIMALVKMRVEKFSSQKTMLDFLMNQLKYKHAYAYELLGECRKRITEIFKEEHEEAFAASIARLQEMIETTKNEKIRLDAEKELNKLLGLHRPVKVEVSGQIDHNITGIDINIVYTNSVDITDQAKIENINIETQH